MKYSEFEREVEKLGLTCTKGNGEVKVRLFGKTVTGVSEIRELIFDNEWSEFQSLGKQTQGQLFDLAYQLAKTPLAEREEEKKYHLRLASRLSFNQRHTFLNVEKDTGICSLNTDRFTYAMKTIFTESEISQMDITGFEKIEVSE